MAVGAFNITIDAIYDNGYICDNIVAFAVIRNVIYLDIYALTM